MSIFESSYKSLLQGVSQQLPRERLPGQVGSQDNMLSDPVTNIRRRPGAQFRYSVPMPDVTSNSVKAWFTDIGGFKVHVLLDTINGSLKVLDEEYNLLEYFPDQTYLQTDDASKIRSTTVGDEFFLANVDKVPSITAGTSGINPTRRGYFYIAAGSFSRGYSVTITSSVGNITASYTTPSGTTAGDAANSTPDYIATQLANALDAVKGTAGLTKVVRIASYVYVEGLVTTSNVSVNSSTGSQYVQVSKASYTAAEGNLPAQLPVDADGYIVSVGSVSSPQYFKYQHSTTAWIESGDYSSAANITNMPISLTYEEGAWTLVLDDFEGRLAGDDKSNPAHRFMTHGITGIGSYQGRLVLLSGPMVSLSASANARRFYRSTVSSIIDSDPVEIGSTGNSSASYEYCVPFNKDLILFSESYQALIPSASTALTPRNAYVVLTSTHEMSTRSAPVSLGRTLMYPMRRSEDFFGVMEMVPSQYTDSQYISIDSTQHLPKYLPGDCRFSVSSTVDNMVLFAPAGDEYSLIVHEYSWDAESKVQQAWHRWTFPYPVAAAYFSNAFVNVLFAQNDTIVGCSVDPRVGVLTFDAERRPFSDLYVLTDIVDNTITLPDWMTDFDPSMASKLVAAVGTGDLAGDKVGFSVSSPSTLTTVRSFPTGPVAIGIPYTSSISPNPPIVKDQNEVVISSNKLTVLRYMIGTKNSSQYEVTVRDAASADAGAESTATLTWSSTELDINRGRYANESISIVPCRTNAQSTTVLISTDGTGELNVISMEYVCRYNQKIKRR